MHLACNHYKLCVPAFFQRLKFPKELHQCAALFTERYNVICTFCLYRIIPAIMIWLLKSFIHFLIDILLAVLWFPVQTPWCDLWANTMWWIRTNSLQNIVRKIGCNHEISFARVLCFSAITLTDNKPTDWRKLLKDLATKKRSLQPAGHIAIGWKHCIPHES